MGQTLTHGVYLPDEGERNCYNGLAANWQILDSSVGTIAEHSTQIAGKAPLVHTHTKSDITDFPALATVATSGSYTDLSNIPASFTPSSHTHGNITNDGKVGTTANLPLITGTGGVVQAGSFGTAANTFCEGNDSRLSDARTPVAHTHSKADVTDLLNSNFIPSANNSYDLGSASNQWNNLYAKNYYYNGTAWGLDKKNHWTNNNTFDTTIRVKSLTQEIGVTPSASRFTYCDFKDKNEISIGQVITAQFVNGYDTISLNMYNNYTNGVKNPNGTSVNSKFEVGLTPAGNPYLNTNGKWLCDLTPIVATLNLGTSTNKWKSLNGINPGALSIPNKDKKADIASEFTDLTGGNNFYIPPVDGFVSINADTEVYCAVVSSTHNTVFWRQSAVATTTGYASITIPVRAGLHLQVKIKSTGAIYAEFYPCLGNV